MKGESKMKHKLTRITALMLAVIMSFSMLLVPVQAASFTDVPEKAWYKAAVDYVSEKGWMNGVGEMTFAPTMDVTRAMFVTLLAAYADEDVDNNSAAFTDTGAGKWYTGSAAWAAGLEIVKGIGDGRFAPNRAITRQDLCVMLYKYLQVSGIELKADADRTYADFAGVSAYAKEAVAFCAASGLVTGFEDGTFRPKNTATRAQVAQILMRLDQLRQGEELPEDPMPAQSFEPVEAGEMTVSVEAPQGALPEGSSMRVSPVTDKATLSSIAAQLEGELLAAADISFANKANNEIEPAAEVEVQISLEGLENAKHPMVVHVNAEGKVEYVHAQLVSANRSGSEKALRFYAKDFSVYAVFDGNEDENARLTVQFWNPVFTDDGDWSLEKGYSVYVTRRDAVNEDGTDESGNPSSVDYVHELIADPSIAQPTGNLLFCGWSVNENYTDAEADGEHTIEYIRDYVYNYLTEKNGDKYANPIVDGTTVVNVYPIIFHFYTVTYMDELGDSAITVKGYYSKEAETEITVNPDTTYSPYNSEETHVGWIRMGLDENGQAGRIYQDGDSMTISANTVLRARVARGFWLFFEENPGEHYKGATYVPPVFCEEGRIPANAEPDASGMELAGYDFDGKWYENFTAGSTQTGDTWANEFDFNTPLEGDTTVYAKWNAKSSADYTVIVWKQKVTDGKNDTEKHYDYVFSTTGSAQPLTTQSSSIDVSAYTGLAGNNSYSYGGQTYDFTGFKFAGTDYSSTVIQPNGSTVINVRYDRELVTLKFYAPTRSTSTSTPAYEDSYSYFVADTNSGSYEFVTDYNENYFRGVKRVTSLSTSLDTNSSYYEYCIFPTSGSSGYSLYYDSSNGWVFNNTIYTSSAYPNARIYRLYRIGQYNFYRALYNTATQTMTGLYGQTLEQNDYTWPTSYWWYEGTNGPGNTRTTFLDAFIPASTSNTVNFYGEPGSGSNQIIWYKQDTNGTTYTKANDATSTSGAFNLSDKYNGFTCESYRKDNGEWIEVGELMEQSGSMYYDADPITSGYQDVEDYSTLEIRFSRNKYVISYNLGRFEDGWGNEITDTGYSGHLKASDPIYYDDDLDSYAKGRLHWYDPSSAGDFKDSRYVFAGWYTSPGCESSSYFGFTGEDMPLGGLTLYAKYVLKQYRVFLDLGADSNPGLNPILPATQDDNFRVNYQGLVSSGEKINVTDSSGLYEFVGWYVKTRENNEDKLSVFNFKTQLSDELATDYTDKLAEDQNRDWIDKKVTLVAKWRRVLIGANGIHVAYHPDYDPDNKDYNGYFDNGPEDHSTAIWMDSQVYIDGAEVIARSASAPFDKDYQFLYWEIIDPETGEGTGRYVYPGQKFTLDSNDAIVEEGGIHNHADFLTHVDAAPATCTETGNVEYWQCRICSRFFRDDHAAVSATLAQITIPALGHNWQNPQYQWSEDHMSCVGTAVCNNDNSHVLTEEGTVTTAITPASPTQNGSVVYTAVFENQIFDTQTYTEILEYEPYAVTYVGPVGYENTMPAAAEYNPGTEITLPTPSANPEGYVFVGWVPQNVTVSDATEAPAYLTGSYTVNSDVTLKALYSYSIEKDEKSYELVSTAPADWSGNYVVSYGTGTSMYLMKGVTPSSNGASIESADNRAAFSASGATLSGTVLTNVAEDYVFTFAPQGGYYTLQSVSTGVYVGETSSYYLGGYTTYNANYCRWTPGTGANASGMTISNSNSSYKYLSFNTSSNYFWAGSSLNTSVRFWKENASQDIHYTTELTQYTVSFSVPNGVTQPASVSVRPGETVRLPSAGAPSGGAFLGWVENPVEKTETAQTALAAGSFTDPITAPKTFYALYSFTESESETVYDLVTSTPSSWTGNYVISYLNTTDMYVMKGITGSYSGRSYESATAGGSASYAVSGIRLESNRLHDVNAQYVFAFAQQGSGYSIQNLDNSAYLGRYVTTESKSAVLRSYSSFRETYCTWTPSIRDSGSALLYNCPSAYDNNFPYVGINDTSFYFWVDGTGNATEGYSTAYTSMYLWKETTAVTETTYYATDPGSGSNSVTEPQRLGGMGEKPVAIESAAPELNAAELSAQPGADHVNADDSGDGTDAVEIWEPADSITAGEEYLIGIVDGSTTYLISSRNDSANHYKTLYNSTSQWVRYQAYMGKAQKSGNNITGVEGDVTNLDYCKWTFSSSTGGTIASVGESGYYLYGASGTSTSTSYYGYTMYDTSSYNDASTTWTYNSSNHRLSGAGLYLYHYTYNGTSVTNELLRGATSSSSAGYIQLYKKSEATEYTVSFKDYDGSALSGTAYQDQSVVTGNLATAPSVTPTREGYTFKCWRYASAEGEMWVFDQYPVSGDMTLYACYEKNASASDVWVPYTQDTIDTSKDYLIGVEHDGNVYLLSGENPVGYGSYYFVYNEDSSNNARYFLGYQGLAVRDGENVTGVNDVNTPSNMEYYVWNFSSNSGGTITSKLNSSIAMDLYRGGNSTDGYEYYSMPYPNTLTPSSDWTWSYTNGTLKTGSYYLGYGSVSYTDGPTIYVSYGYTSKPDVTVRLYTKAVNYDITYMAGNENLGTDHVSGAVNLRTTALVIPGYDFIGWMEGNLAETTIAPSYYAPGASYTGSANVTMHALYKRTVSTETTGTAYKLLTAAPSNWSGDYVITNGTTTSAYAMTGLSSGTSYETASNGGQTLISGINGVTISNNTMYNVPDRYVFTLRGSGSSKTFRNKDVGTYVIAGGSSSNTLTASSSSANWTFTYSNGCVLPAIVAGVYGTTTYYIRWYNDTFWLTNSTSVTPNIYFWKASDETVVVDTDYYTTEVVTTTYAVHFDANGGAGEMADQEVPASLPTNLNPNAFTRFGYDFSGWNTASDGNGTAYEDEGLVTLNDEDLSLYAQWTPKTFTVSFDANGGTGSMASQSFTYGVSANLTPNTFTAPEGKVFVGWNTASDGSGDAYGDQEAVSMEASIILYAQWDEPQIWYPTAKVVPGEEYLIGYQDASGNVYLLMNYNPDKLTSKPTGSDANQNENYYYANADNNWYSYGVQAVMENGNVTGVVNSVYSTAALSNTVWVFEKNGDYLKVRSGADDASYLRVSHYILNYDDVIPSDTHLEYSTNWKWDEANGTLSYVSGSLSRLVTYVPTVDEYNNFFNAPINGTAGYSNLKLFSRTAATFNVTFVDSFTGEDVEINTQEVTVHHAAKAPANVPVHLGYVFDGWEEDFSDVTSDLTVHAKYVAHADVTVSFRNTDGSDVLNTDGNVIASQTIQASATATEPVPVPQAPEGFYFKEWQLNGIRFDFSTPVTEDIVLTPAFTRAETTSYTVMLRAVYGPKRAFKTTHVVWYADNEACASKQSEEVVLNNRISILDPTGLEEFRNPGYKFLGWARLSENVIEGGKLTSQVTWNEEQNSIIKYSDLNEDDLWLTYHSDGDAPYFTVKVDGTDRVVTHIAANENMPYHGLYAVWAPRSTFYVYHSSTGKLEAFEIPETAVENGGLKTSFDLTRLVSDGCLYGGYYKTYGGVNTQKLNEFIGSSEATNFGTANSWSEPVAYVQSGTSLTRHTIETDGIEALNFRPYDATALTTGGERYWTKAKAYTSANGDDRGNVMHPKAGEIYYLKEVPETYLTTKYLYTYDKDTGVIANFFMITVTDDTYYSNVGFRCDYGADADAESTANVQDVKWKDALVATFNVVQSGDEPVPVKVNASNFGLTRGYVGVKNEDNLVGAKNVFTVMPVWKTLDGVEVNSRGALKLTVNAAKTAISYELLGTVSTPYTSIYVNVNPVKGDWLKDGAITRLYFFVDPNKADEWEWVETTAVTGKEGYFKAEIPAGSWTGYNVVRCKKDSTLDDGWDAKWNQTSDIPFLPSESNYVSIDGTNGLNQDYYFTTGVYNPN